MRPHSSVAAAASLACHTRLQSRRSVRPHDLRRTVHSPQARVVRIKLPVEHRNSSASLYSSGCAPASSGVHLGGATRRQPTARASAQRTGRALSAEKRNQGPSLGRDHADVVRVAVVQHLRARRPLSVSLAQTRRAQAASGTHPVLKPELDLLLGGVARPHLAHLAAAAAKLTVLQEKRSTAAPSAALLRDSARARRACAP